MAKPYHYFVLLLFLFVCRQGECLQCYVCTSPVGKGVTCDINVSVIPPRTCSEYCGKSITNAGYVSILTRACVPKNYCDDTMVAGRTSCEVCHTDLCNASEKVRISTYLLFGSSLYVLKYVGNILYS